MTTQVVAPPTRPNPRARVVAIGALALALAAGVGAAMGALATSSSSDSAAVTQPVAAAPVDTACPGDGGYLFAKLASLPAADAGTIARELSPQTRALLQATVLVSAATGAVPSVPDTATLAAVLGRIGSDDARAIVGGLSPTDRAALEAIAPAPRAAC
jgi:hypothetical protein